MSGSQWRVISKITALTDVWYKEKQGWMVSALIGLRVNCEVSHLSAVIDWPQRARKRGKTRKRKRRAEKDKRGKETWGRGKDSASLRWRGKVNEGDLTRRER